MAFFSLSMQQLRVCIVIERIWYWISSSMCERKLIRVVFHFLIKAR